MDKLFEDTKEAKIVECKSDFQDFTLLTEPPIPLHRLDSPKGRLYFTEDYQFYPGVTSVISALSDSPDALLEWMIKHGSLEASRKEMNRLAYIGSAMHTIIAHRIINGKFDIDEMRTAIMDEVNLKEMLMKGLEPYYVADRLAKNILSFEKFLRDHKVKPIAIELPLCCSLGVASMVDFFVKMTIEKKGEWGEVYKSGVRKGQPKETKKEIEVFAIIDFKSGMKAYSNKGHELQLQFYDVMIRENYPEFKDKEIYLYNWHPKDWESEVGYSLMNQTGKHDLEELELMTRLYRKRHNPTRKRMIRTFGKLDADSVLSDNYKIEDLKDLAHKYLEDRE